MIYHIGQETAILAEAKLIVLYGTEKFGISRQA
jgi:hypothetical protein